MYRRLSWSQGAVRLRVLLGESGTHANHQVLAWMFVIRFLFWHIPAGRVMHVVTETGAQFELTFYLPPLAKLVVDLMDLCWRLRELKFCKRWGLFQWDLFNPQVTILRDPDFCATNRTYQPLSLRLFGGDGGEREYREQFKESQKAEVEAEEEGKSVPAPTQSAAVTSPGPVPHSRAWWLKLVVDNAPVPEHEPQELMEVPPWLQGVGDTKTLYEGEDTDPLGLEVTPGTPEYLRPSPVRR